MAPRNDSTPPNRPADRQVYDRRYGRFFHEKVYGGDFIRWAYGAPRGRSLIDRSWVQRALSKIAGFYYDSGLSAGGIAPFIRDYEIPMADFVEPGGGFSSFNEFFVRKYRPGLRDYPTEASELGSPAEGRLSLFEIHAGRCSLFVKDQATELSGLYGALGKFAPKQGHAWVFRLCPVDYHCFHFPDAGRVAAFGRVGGLLHSVNPIAQAAVPSLFFKNERHVTILDTDNFGRVALIEVGAICVGLIRQHFGGEGSSVRRGQEKGDFKFGASTVILVTDSEHVKPDADLLERSRSGVETLVRLGETIGRRP